MLSRWGPHLWHPGSLLRMARVVYVSLGAFPTRVGPSDCKQAVWSGAPDSWGHSQGDLAVLTTTGFLNLSAASCWTQSPSAEDARVGAVPEGRVGEVDELSLHSVPHGDRIPQYRRTRREGDMPEGRGGR